jgi:hypothetical protein
VSDLDSTVGPMLGDPVGIGQGATLVSSSDSLPHPHVQFSLQNSIVSNLEKFVIFYIKSISFMVCMCVLVYSCLSNNPSIRSWLTTRLSGWGCYTYHP